MAIKYDLLYRLQSATYCYKKFHGNRVFCCNFENVCIQRFIVDSICMYGNLQILFFHGCAAGLRLLVDNIK